MVKTFPFFFFLYHQKCFLSIFSSLRNEWKIFNLCHIFYHVLGAFFYNNKNWTGKNNSNIFGFLRYSMASIFFLMLLVYKKFSKDDIKMFATWINKHFNSCSNAKYWLKIHICIYIWFCKALVHYIH